MNLIYGQSGRDYLDGHDDASDRLDGGLGRDVGWWDLYLDRVRGIELGQGN